MVKLKNIYIKNWKTGKEKTKKKENTIPCHLHPDDSWYTVYIGIAL
jgi:hypothetical protein